MKYGYIKSIIGGNAELRMRVVLLSAFLIAHFSFLICPIAAQGMVTEIKIIAIHYAKDLDEHAKGYVGADENDKDKLSKDFRKGKGGGYVFALFKHSSDTAKYITDVVVTADKGMEYGRPYTSGDKTYTPAVFYQELGEHYDSLYRGGLNGRNYSVYGGAYENQPHVYVSRSGNKDFKNKILKKAEVFVSKPKNLDQNQTMSGGHAGGGRYFVFTWHYHEPTFERFITDEAPDGSYQVHIRKCEKDNCGIRQQEPHRFEQRFGSDEWGQFPSADPRCKEYHYKKCKDCGQIVPAVHQFASYVVDSEDHNKRCLLCDYVDDAGHVGFGKQKLPVDEKSHIIYCDSCGFLKKFPHDYTYNRSVELEECERSVVRYSCSQCYHQKLIDEAGIGHDFNAYGICNRKGCIHPYERPGVEPFGTGDSIYVVKNFGHLYWVSYFVNSRHPKINIRVDNDLIADDFMNLRWRPIGATDSTAFQGTFDGGGHVITMLKTEEPQAGTNNRGLFGAIAKGATVKNVALAACNFSGWNNIGAVAGVNEGTISGCQVVFSVLSSIGTGMNIGGICGLNKGTITDCTTQNSVWVGGVRDYAGGICGTNEGGSLSGNTSAAICGSGSDAVLPEAASQH